MRLQTIQSLDSGLASAKLLSERTKPATTLGMDATRIRTFVLTDEVVELTLGKFQIEIGKHPEIGEYKTVILHGVAINFHGACSPRSGKQVVRARVMCVTWEPEGAAQANGDGRLAFRNFSLHIDVLEKSEAPVQSVLAVLNGRERLDGDIPANCINIERGEFSHLSINKKRAQTIVLYAPRVAD